MAEKTDWTKLSKKELQEMLRRQEKLMANKKLLQSLPDKGNKVLATIEKLQELIARREELDDTVAQFERMTISRLVERTRLDCLDSDGISDAGGKMSMNLNKGKGFASDADLHDKTSHRHKERVDTKKSENKQTDRKWNYESSATPPVYNFEKAKPVSLDESFVLLQDQEKGYKDLQAQNASLTYTLKEEDSSTKTDFMRSYVIKKSLQYREATQDDSLSDDNEHQEDNTRQIEVDSDDDDDDDNLLD